jgi:hypothetical protein
MPRPMKNWTKGQREKEGNQHVRIKCVFMEA